MNETLPGIVSSVNTDTYRDYVHIPRLKYDTRNHLPHHASVIIPIFNACTILFDDSLPATNAQPNVLRVHVILLRRYQPPRTYVRYEKIRWIEREKGEKKNAHLDCAHRRRKFCWSSGTTRPKDSPVPWSSSHDARSGSRAAATFSS